MRVVYNESVRPKYIIEHVVKKMVIWLQLFLSGEPRRWSLTLQSCSRTLSTSKIVWRKGRCLLLLLRIRSAHLEILGFPIGGAY